MLRSTVRPLPKTQIKQEEKTFPGFNSYDFRPVKKNAIFLRNVPAICNNRSAAKDGNNFTALAVVFLGTSVIARIC